MFRKASIPFKSSLSICNYWRLLLKGNYSPLVTHTNKTYLATTTRKPMKRAVNTEFCIRVWNLFSQQIWTNWISFTYLATFFKSNLYDRFENKFIQIVRCEQNALCKFFVSWQKSFLLQWNQIWNLYIFFNSNFKKSH